MRAFELLFEASAGVGRKYQHVEDLIFTGIPSKNIPAGAEGGRAAVVKPLELQLEWPLGCKIGPGLHLVSAQDAERIACGRTGTLLDFLAPADAVGQVATIRAADLLSFAFNVCVTGTT